MAGVRGTEERDRRYIAQMLSGFTTLLVKLPRNGKQIQRVIAALNVYWPEDGEYISAPTLYREVVQALRALWLAIPEEYEEEAAMVAGYETQFKRRYAEKP
jgi:hypothetical protein